MVMCTCIRQINDSLLPRGLEEGFRGVGREIAAIKSVVPHTYHHDPFSACGRRDGIQGSPYMKFNAVITDVSLEGFVGTHEMSCQLMHVSAPYQQ